MKKNVALALSSGGARGLVHIGAIEELEAQGYRITSVAGGAGGAGVSDYLCGGLFDGCADWWCLCGRQAEGVQGVDEDHRPEEDAGADRLLVQSEPPCERYAHHRGHHGVCARYGD